MSSVTGQVVDQQNKPIKGAAVSCTLTRRRNENVAAVGEQGKQRQFPLLDTIESIVETATSEDGRFELKQLNEESPGLTLTMLKAVAPGFNCKRVKVDYANLSVGKIALRALSVAPKRVRFGKLKIFDDTDWFGSGEMWIKAWVNGNTPGAWGQYDMSSDDERDLSKTIDIYGDPEEVVIKVEVRDNDEEAHAHNPFGGTDDYDPLGVADLVLYRSQDYGRGQIFIVNPQHDPSHFQINITVED